MFNEAAFFGAGLLRERGLLGSSFFMVVEGCLREPLGRGFLPDSPALHAV